MTQVQDIGKAWIVVCRNSTEFNLKQAAAVKQQFDRLPHKDWRFLCLTDTPTEDWHIPLITNNPGWWAIMESFRFHGPHILTGLDTVLMSDIEPLLTMAENCPADVLYGIRDFYRPERWASGVTMWNGDWTPLFDKCDEKQRQQYRGNQDFTEAAVLNGMIQGRTLRFVQDELDGIISYKRDIRDAKPRLRQPPQGTRICCFHGQPRPWAVREKEPWLADFIPKPEPLPIFRLPSDATCVLVGNGPSSLEARNGDKIDAFEHVVRLNNYMIEGFEAFVGSKTTLWAFTPGVVPPRSSPVPPSALSLHGPNVPAPAPVQHLYHVEKTFYRGVQDSMQHRAFWHSGLERETVGLVPSTGLVVAVWLLRFAGLDKITLVGFDHFSRKKTGQHHYWREGSFPSPKEHDGEAEAALFADLVRTGRVVYLA